MEIINTLNFCSLVILWVHYGFDVKGNEDYTEMKDSKRVLNCSLYISFWLSLILVPYFLLPIGCIVTISIIAIMNNIKIN